jgi:hypothetical protein
VRYLSLWHVGAPGEFSERGVTDVAEILEPDLASEKAVRGEVEVTCVLPSKLVGMFEGQLGAAFYRTTVGVTDVMFMSVSMDFEIHVVEAKRTDTISTLLKESLCEHSGLGCEPSVLFHPIPQRHVYDGR